SKRLVSGAPYARSFTRRATIVGYIRRAAVSDGPVGDLERRRTRYQQACGCPQSAVALLLAVAALAVIRPGVVSAIALLFAAALAGKLAGLAWARWALRRVERELGVRA